MSNLVKSICAFAEWKRINENTISMVGFLNGTLKVNLEGVGFIVVVFVL